VHDWLALAIGFVVIGHVWFALNDRQARIGMRTGYVTRGWAEREHPAWAAEVAARNRPGDQTPGPDTVREAEDRAARGEAGARDRVEGGAVHQARAWDK
jgi:formate dehydrogenase subunit gamma